MLIWMNSKLTWSHTPVSISHWLVSLPSCLSTRRTTLAWTHKKSRKRYSSHKTKWWSVTLERANTCRAACCTVVTWSREMWMLPSPRSSRSTVSNSLTGVQLDSKWASTTRHCTLKLVPTCHPSNAPSACWATQQPWRRFGLALTTSLIWCTGREPSFTGKFLIILTWMFRSLSSSTNHPHAN